MTSEFNDKEKQLEILNDFIRSNPKPEELKRALAIKLVWQNDTYNSRKERLCVSVGFISKWKKAFERHGIKKIQLCQEGSKGYLSRKEKEDVVDWLIQQESWDISELETFKIEKYDVVFKSRQSYYQIFKETRIKWQKGEHKNPRQNPEEITKKNQEIANLLNKHKDEIKEEKLVVYIIDECHLLSKDLCGYMWNFISLPLKIPLTNYRDRQTYYGALNFFTGDFILTPYKSGNGKLT